MLSRENVIWKHSVSELFFVVIFLDLSPKLYQIEQISTICVAAKKINVGARKTIKKSLSIEVSQRIALLREFCCIC